MILRRVAVALLAVCASQTGLAATATLQLDLPTGALQTATRSDPTGLWTLATGPALPGEAVPVETVAGGRSLTAWRVAGAAPDALDAMIALRRQIEAAGWDVVFLCAAPVCGGYDFRHSRDVLPLPAMFVDLGDYLYLAASAADGGSAVEILVSPAGNDLSLQISRLGAAATAEGTTKADTPPAATEQGASPVPRPTRHDDDASAGAATASAPGTDAAAGQDWTAARVDALLARDGHVPLYELGFDAAGATLAEGPTPQLAALADWLTSDPTRRIAIVGHSDWTGPLEGNVVLSRRRAAAIADRLTGGYGVSAGQLDVHGIGFLAPRSGNATPEGRRLNRRVDIIALPTPAQP